MNTPRWFPLKRTNIWAPGMLMWMSYIWLSIQSKTMRSLFSAQTGSCVTWLDSTSGGKTHADKSLEDNKTGIVAPSPYSQNWPLPHPGRALNNRDNVLLATRLMHVWTIIEEFPTLPPPQKSQIPLSTDDVIARKERTLGMHAFIFLNSPCQVLIMNACSTLKTSLLVQLEWTLMRTFLSGENHVKSNDLTNVGCHRNYVETKKV